MFLIFAFLQHYEEKDDKIILSLVTAEIQKLISDSENVPVESSFRWCMFLTYIISVDIFYFISSTSPTHFAVT